MLLLRGDGELQDHHLLSLILNNLKMTHGKNTMIRMNLLDAYLR